MSTTPFSAIAPDLEFTAHKQQQCGQALRALACLAEPDAAGDAKAAPPMRRDDLHALLSVIADQALLLATEAQDNISAARKLCA